MLGSSRKRPLVSKVAENSQPASIPILGGPLDVSCNLVLRQSDSPRSVSDDDRNSFLLVELGTEGFGSAREVHRRYLAFRDVWLRVTSGLSQFARCPFPRKGRFAGSIADSDYPQSRSVVFCGRPETSAARCDRIRSIPHLCLRWRSDRPRDSASRSADGAVTVPDQWTNDCAERRLKSFQREARSPATSETRAEDRRTPIQEW